MSVLFALAVIKFCKVVPVHCRLNFCLDYGLVFSSIVWKKLKAEVVLITNVPYRCGIF